MDLDCLDRFLDTMSEDSFLYFKLKDIRRLYQDFEEYLSDKYITKEEMLDVLCSAVPRSDILKGSVIAMDGFTGFTPVQDRLLKELLKVCDKVMITVEMDGREDPFVYTTPYQLFALSKQMTTTLVKIAREAGTSGGGTDLFICQAALSFPGKSCHGISGIRSVPLFQERIPRERGGVSWGFVFTRREIRLRKPDM